MNRICLGICFLIFLISCHKEPIKTADPKVYKLIQKQDKVFELDTETSYNRIKPYLKTLNDSLFYVFLNRTNSHFYLYDYTSGKLKDKITVYKEGPNQVQGNFFSYYIHNLDSIFINPWHGIKYLINKQGVVVDKTEIKQESGAMPGNENLYFDRATSIKNGKLLTGRRVLVPKLKASNPLRVTFDFNAGTFEDAYLEEKSIVPGYDALKGLLDKLSKSNMVSTMDKFVVGSEDHLFASSEINDSIYEYKKGQLVNAHYAGDPKIKTADYLGFHNKIKINITEKGITSYPRVEQPPYYIDMFMDEEKEWLYRILIHGTRDVKGNNDFRDSEVIGASLIAFNLENLSSTVFDIPIDEVRVSTSSGGNYFATKEGIHFPVKEQEIESVKRYKVFKLE